MKQRLRRASTTRWARVSTLFVVLVAFVAGATTVFAGSSNTGGGLQNELQLRVESNEGYLTEHRDASGRLRPDLWRTGVAQFRNLPVSATWHDARVSGKALASPASATSSAVTGAFWKQIGPAPLRIDNNQNFQGAGPDSGEVVGIAIDPRGTTDQTVYIAANDGGIWKTTDGGNHWKPLTDSMPSNSMGDVALDPGNPSIVYAGTGNLFDGGGVFFKGVGLYKSLDGGGSWAIENPGGIFSNLGVNRIEFTGANQLLVATNSGLFKSIDGGATFGNNSPTFNNGSAVLGGSISDLDVDPTNSATVYASVTGSGVFRSTDSGATFPTNLFSNPGSPGTSGFGFVGFAVATTDNQRLYALVRQAPGCAALTAAQSPPFGANRCAQLYRSNDGGANWTLETDAANRSIENGGCQCGYDQMISVDPQNADRVYIAFQELYTSSDGGVSFGTPAPTRNKLHWDHHAMTYSPSTHWSGTPTRLWVGEDGGLGYTDDAASNWTLPNEGIATNLFNSIDIGRGSATNNEYTFGGNQDTGTIGHRPGDSGTDWHLGVDGDGSWTAVSQQDPKTVYGLDDGCFMKSTDGGGSWNFPAASGTTPPGCAFPPGFSAGIVAVDPNNDSNVWVGQGNSIWRSTDGGNNWTAFATGGGSVSSFGPAKLDSNVLWIGLSNGKVLQSTNALAATPTVTSHTVTGAPGAAVSGVAVDPTNTDEATVVYPGFNGVVAGVAKHVFQTTDAGTTWTNVSGIAGGLQNLPDLPLHSVVIDAGTTPHSIIVSADAGVARSLDGGATWQQLGVGLPNADATQLQIDPSADPPLLRVGTYGRSVFELTAPTGPQIAVNTDLGFGNVGLGQRVSRIVQVFNVGTADLHISGFSRLSGSTAFSLVPTSPPTPTTIQPGEELDFTIQFQPTTRGNQTAIFHIQSDDPSQPDFQLSASGTGVTGKIAVSGSLDFGTVPRGTSATRDITVQNTGLAPLTVSSVALLGGSDPAFSIVPNPGTPQTIQPSDSVVFSVRFAPPATSNGTPRTGTVRVSSDDPDNPTVDISATGTPGVPHNTISSSSFDFGGVPVDNRTTPHQVTRTLTVTNQSSCALCDLTITSLAFSGPQAADFTLVGAPATPFVIGAGNHVDLVIRFNPSAGGIRNATLTVNSDDPGNPSQAVSLTGEGLLPAIDSAPGTPTSPLIFGPTVYDPNCGIFCGATQTETFTNVGQAELIADIVAFTGDPAFSGPGAASPPDRFAQGTSLSEPVTFHPTAPARKVTGAVTLTDTFPFDSATVTRTVPLCGEAVGRGIRVLVEDNAGNPITTPVGLQLRAVGTSPNVIINANSLTLQTISPPTSCQTIRFHYENQKLPATDEDHPSSSYYTLVASVGGNRKSSITFTLAPNQFRQIVMIVDTDPPTIFAPAVVKVTTKLTAVRVKFNVRARDRHDGRVGVRWAPDSGSLFRVGKTSVTCRANDRAGNKAVRRFKVVVRHRR